MSHYDRDTLERGSCTSNRSYNWLKLTTWWINWESLEIVRNLRGIIEIVRILRGIIKILRSSYRSKKQHLRPMLWTKGAG